MKFTLQRSFILIIVLITPHVAQPENTQNILQWDHFQQVGPYPIDFYDDQGIADETYRNRIKKDVKLVSWSDKKRKEFEKYRAKFNVDLYRGLWKAEEQKFKNDSLCEHTVVPVTLKPEKANISISMQEVVCKDAGSRCRDSGTHYCTQAYQIIKVESGFGSLEKFEFKSGCMCTSQRFGTLPYFNFELNTKD